jgi:ParB-like chromosome segregation protein Spo0J
VSSEIIESDRAGNSDDPTQLRFHPLADLFPLMEGEEFDALVADIKAHGLREPIVLLDGKILDGRNRYRACLAAGVEPTLENHFSAHHSTGEALAFIISKNIHRRHLTAEQKRDLIAKLIEVAPEKSDRAIAKQAKVAGKTVASVRREKEARAEIPHVETRTDTKGRKQPAKKGWSRERHKRHRASKRGRAAGKGWGAPDSEAELREKLRAAEIKIAGLESEVQELKAENAKLRRQLEAKDDGLDIPDCLRRAPTPSTGGAS